MRGDLDGFNPDWFCGSIVLLGRFDKPEQAAVAEAFVTEAQRLGQPFVVMHEHATPGEIREDQVPLVVLAIDPPRTGVVCKTYGVSARQLPMVAMFTRTGSGRRVGAKASEAVEAFIGLAAALINDGVTLPQETMNRIGENITVCGVLRDLDGLPCLLARNHHGAHNHGSS